MNRHLVFVLIILNSVFLYAGGSQGMTLDNAIDDYASGLISRISPNTEIAVNTFETNSQALRIYFLDTMIAKIGEKTGDIMIYERQRLEAIQNEWDFSFSEYVNPETAARGSHLSGAGVVIYGTLSKIGNNYQMKIWTTNVETGRILFSKPYNIRVDARLSDLLGLEAEKENERLEKIALENAQKEKDKQEKKERLSNAWKSFWFADGKKFGSIGINIGTSFATPLLIGNANITVPVFPNTFLEGGVDIGLFHGNAYEKEIKDVEYQSWYYYGRFNAFVPFSRDSEYDYYKGEYNWIDYGGWYIGAGVGFMDSKFKFLESPIDEVSMQILALDATTGFFIGKGHHLGRIGYAVRTNFSGVNHRLVMGYTFRIF